MTTKASNPDLRFIDGLCANDHQVIGEICRVYGEQAKKHVLANSGNLQDAENVFQETLIILLRKTCRPEFVLTGTFGGYFMRILTRKWLDELRKRGRSGVTLPGDDGYMKEPGEQVDTLIGDWFREETKLEIFLRCFKQLSEKCQEIIRLSLEEDNLKEVARLLETTHGYVRKRRSKCLGKLRDLVKKDPGYHQLFDD